MQRLQRRPRSEGDIPTLVPVLPLYLNDADDQILKDVDNDAPLFEEP